MRDDIFVKGARQNNLKNIDVSIPRNKLVVFTGLSGSGKSSLAFDTIFAEGQRRYVESLSSYARQFLGQMDKPDVDYIEGLSPAISIDQKTTSHNPRSTVGTVTEIYDYFRLLFARIGRPHCPKCGKEIARQTVDQICDKIFEAGEGARLYIMAPVIRGRKGEYSKNFESYRKNGYMRVRVDGTDYSLDDDEIKLDKNLKHDIYVTVDRIVLKENSKKRLSEAIEAAVKLSDGLVVCDDGKEETLYSVKYACPDCDISMEELTPRLFSFNSPYGACPVCHGLGFKNDIDISMLIKDETKSLEQGAVEVSGWNMENGKMTQIQFKALSERYGFSLSTPFKDLPEKIKHIIFYGNGGEKIKMVYDFPGYSGTYYQKYEGIAVNLLRRYHETSSEYAKHEIEKYMRSVPCENCGGKRLKKEALAVTINERTIMDLCEMPICDLAPLLKNLPLTKTELTIGERILKEIDARLQFLLNVGLSYLSLSRASATLSGGESQRIRLATQIGSGLMGVLYILDEPSIGLHQRDNEKLIATLTRLRDMGNTLIVVEHDEDTMRAADYIVDIGPGAGESGGYLVAFGTPEEVAQNENSVTGQYLSGKKKIPLPEFRKQCDGRYLSVFGAHKNNLKNIDVRFPLGLLTAVTGVSGSGKSSLVNEIVVPELANKLNRAREKKMFCDKIEGVEHLDKVIVIDQSPIGRTPRSNPATYTGVFTNIRELFSVTKDAKERGYKTGRFSFNVSGGRCENCMGDGIIKIEMHFLPDVYIPCEVCGGKRYNRETLEVKYKGKSIYDVLEMSVEEACGFFENVPSIYNKIRTLRDVGLSYIKLGQPATTLSGGEAQRVKLATELSKRQTGKTMFILDEPTTGLHSEDVSKLIAILQRLVSSGNSVIVIEHNLDVIKVSDYIIDLGPEGGDGGGTIVAEGTPEEIAQNPKSYTGQFLKKILF